jgi:hypothetical protein
VWQDEQNVGKGKRNTELGCYKEIAVPVFAVEMELGLKRDKCSLNSRRLQESWGSLCEILFRHISS